MKTQDGFARMSIELSAEVVEALEKLRIEWGLRGKAAIVDRLLRDLLLTETDHERRNYLR